MAAGATFFSYISTNPDVQKLLAAAVVGTGIFILGKSVVSRISNVSSIEKELIPRQKAGLFGLFDICIEQFIKFADTILGKENRRHIPFVASIFFFILFANLLGLIPGMPAITTSVWINVSMALVVFVYFNMQGIKANGLLGYLKHFCGPMVVMAPVIFPIEIVSTCLRVLTLNLRLYWNIAADHMVLDVFTKLLGPILPLPFYLLGTFVSFMQALVFAILTMIYILLATDHGEEAHH
jgi:F-type H+-transporting ATPase subunit a